MAEPRLVLDAGAVIALLRREPAGSRVAQLLQERACMCTINAAEVVDVLPRVYGWTAEQVIDAVEQLLRTVAQPIPASLELATKAGELRARLYDHRRGRLSLADCFVLATAEAGDRVVTTDGTLADAARDEGVEVILLGPGSA